MKINITRSSMPSYEEYCNEIKPIFESRWLTNMGPLHNEFAKKVADYLKVAHLAPFVNGHLALMTGIKAMQLTGEVITTPFTFASTTHAIVENGLTPVFCDVEGDSYTIDPSKVEALITDKTSAIVAVHVYGNVCDVKKLEEIADKHSLKLIFDAAHVFGTELDGRGIASFGDMSMFSFHATKVFNTIEGGALCYKDSALDNKISQLRNFGITSPESVDYVGTNAKMNEFQAAMGLCNLRHVDEYIEARKKAYDHYVERLSGVSGIRLCPKQAGVTPNYAYFPVVFDGFGKNRDEVALKLSEHDIFARKYFYPITNEFSCYKGKYRGETPVAKKISEQVLTLPMYEGLSCSEVDAICDIILK